MPLLKQQQQDGEVDQYLWIDGSKIVADAFTKAGSRMDVLEEVLKKNVFKPTHSRDKIVTVKDGEI